MPEGSHAFQGQASGQHAVSALQTIERVAAPADLLGQRSEEKNKERVWYEQQGLVAERQRFFTTGVPSRLTGDPSARPAWCSQAQSRR